MREQIVAVLQALEAFVANMYGPDPNKLGDFGFSPKKAHAESAETRATAVVKARGTREAKKAALAAIKSPATLPGSTTKS